MHRVVHRRMESTPENPHDIRVRVRSSVSNTSGVSDDIRRELRQTLRTMEFVSPIHGASWITDATDDSDKEGARSIRSIAYMLQLGGSIPEIPSPLSFSEDGEDDSDQEEPSAKSHQPQVELSPYIDEFEGTSDIVDKEGWLVKEGRIHHNWKKRWFVLRGEALSYFTVKHRKFKGSIPLGACIVRTAVGRADKKECIELLTEGRKLFFDSVTSEDRDEWIVAINNKAASLQYLKKMKFQHSRPNPRIMAFFNETSSTELDLSGSDLPLEAAVPLSQPLRFHKFLSRLLLNNCGVTNIMFSALYEAIAENDTIGYLDLGNNHLTGKEAGENLSKMLERNNIILQIKLDGNPLGNDGMMSLEEGLRKHNPPLRHISTARTGISDDGCASFLRGIAASCVDLRGIYLDGNDIGPEGVRSLAYTIASGAFPKLEKLSLGWNKLGNDGTFRLVDTITKYPIQTKRLVELDLSHNGIWTAGAEALFTLIRKGRIHRLDMGGNRLGENTLRDAVSDGKSLSGASFVEFRLTKT